MRCIEILADIKERTEQLMININMRCIEICYRACKYVFDSGLTLTWDVLK